MRRLSLILIALFLLFAMTAGVLAQEDQAGLRATLGSEATVYPSFADVSLDADILVAHQSRDRVRSARRL